MIRKRKDVLIRMIPRLGPMLSVTLMIMIALTTGLKSQGVVVVNPNGSFEQSAVTVSGDTASVQGWNFFVQDGAAGTYAIVDSEAKDGSKSLAVTVEGTGTEEWSLGAVNEPYVLNPDYTYSLTLWAKASEAGATANFTVGLPASDNFSELGRIGSSDVSLTTEWQEFSFDFTVPAGADTARTPLHFSFEDNVGKTIYIDSVRITAPNTMPIIVEAEEGMLGSNIADSTDGEVNFITTLVNNTEFYPGENRTASYNVTFPGPGAYDLFVRLRVGAETFDDDSFFYGESFGEHEPDTTAGWVLVNGMGSSGFSAEDAVVRGPGGLGAEEWKWVNLSRNAFPDTAITFVITEGEELTKTFQLGTREDGLDIDKFAFGDSAVYFTVGNLDNGEPGSLTDPTEQPEPQDPIAQGKIKWLGNIYSSAQVEGFTNYWNQVTPENAGKWGSVEGTRDQMNWSGMDAAYNLAKDNGFPIRFHILIWGGQQPGWINDLSTEEQREEIEEWMDAVAQRYPDLDYVEVVNEGSNGHQLPDGQSGDADYIDALGGTGETGHDWIITAFEMARDRFPDSKLMINDYGIVGNMSATENYIDIIEDLQERGLIDVIGVQSHAFSTRGSVVNMRNTLDALGETGLPIQATEMDIDGNPTGTDAESDQRQLEDYQRIFPVFWEHPKVEGVTLWGWRPGLWRQDQEAFLVRNNGEERPALEWLRAYVDTADVPFTVSNEDFGDAQPRDYVLYHNYPNPFNPTTRIAYSIPVASEVTINVYDVTGRQIQTLVNRQQTAGRHTVSFNAANLSSGIYFYEIKAGSFREVKRMTLVK